MNKKNVNIRESNEEFTREQILKDCFEITPPPRS